MAYPWWYNVATTVARNHDVGNPLYGKRVIQGRLSSILVFTPRTPFHPKHPVSERSFLLEVHITPILNSHQCSNSSKFQVFHPAVPTFYQKSDFLHTNSPSAWFSLSPFLSVYFFYVNAVTNCVLRATRLRKQPIHGFFNGHVFHQKSPKLLSSNFLSWLQTHSTSITLKIISTGHRVHYQSLL